MSGFHWGEVLDICTDLLSHMYIVEACAILFFKTHLQTFTVIFNYDKCSALHPYVLCAHAHHSINNPKLVHEERTQRANHSATGFDGTGWRMLKVRMLILCQRQQGDRPTGWKHFGLLLWGGIGSMSHSFPSSQNQLRCFFSAPCAKSYTIEWIWMLCCQDVRLELFEASTWQQASSPDRNNTKLLESARTKQQHCCRSSVGSWKSSSICTKWIQMMIMNHDVKVHTYIHIYIYTLYYI